MSLTQLPIELIGTILIYLPESEVEPLCLMNRDFEAAKCFARKRRRELTTLIRNTRQYFERLRSHRCLYSLTVRFRYLDPLPYRGLFTVLSSFSELTSLNLSYLPFHSQNRILLFRDVLNSLQITSLNLSHTKLTNESFRILVPSLNRMSSLTSLNLSGNDINLADFQISDQLISLDISEIRAKKVFQDFIGTSRLTYLDISNNHLGIEIPSLTYFPKLQSLNLDGNELDNSELLRLEPSLKMIPSLTSLTLETNLIGIKGLQTLVRIIPHLPNLRTFSIDEGFQFQNVAHQWIRLINEILYNLPHLESLSLGSIVLTDFPLFFPMSLKSLCLSASPIPQTRQIINVNGQAISNLHNLESLSLGAGIGNKILSIVFRSLPFFTRLTTLEIEGLGYIERSEEFTNALSHLHLTKLYLRGIYVYSLRESFNQLSFLTELHLRDCELTNQTLSYLLPSIKNLRYLKTLDLRGNCFFQDVFPDIIDLLQFLPSLSVLSLLDDDRTYKYISDFQRQVYPLYPNLIIN